MNNSDWATPNSDAARTPPLTQSDLVMIKELKRLTAECVGWRIGQNNMLKTDLELIDDALRFHAVEGWMSVRSVINNLTDKNEIDDLIETVNPESSFHGNRNAVDNLVGCLTFWGRTMGFFAEADQMVTVFNLLSEDAAWTARFLQAHGR